MALGILYFGGFLILWLAGRQLTSVQPGVDLRPGDPQVQVEQPRPSQEAGDDSEADPAEEPSEEEAN
jgi:hypothetical protein